MDVESSPHIEAYPTFAPPRRTAPSSLINAAPGLQRLGLFVAGRLGEARAGDGGLTMIEGPAGIGKTSLLRAVRAQAEQAGMRVLSGRGSELEQPSRLVWCVRRSSILWRSSPRMSAPRFMAGQAAHATPCSTLARDAN